MFVIGIAGQAQNGKDTIADRLAEMLNAEHVSLDGSAHNPKWLRTAFASNVKKVYCDTFGVDLDFVEKWKVVPEPPPGFDMTVRQALQFIGDGFRRIKSSIWMDLVFRDKSRPIIISDVRYVNEFTRVKAEGGMNLLVGRPDKVNDDPNGSEAQIRPYVEWALKHLGPYEDVKECLDDMEMTEVMGGPIQPTYPKGMNMFDMFVRNDGSMADLMSVVDGFVVPFVKKYVFEFPCGNKENECLISS